MIKPAFRLELTNSDFPIGRQNWDLIQGDTICDNKIGSSIQLIFSPCYPGKFTCASGQCVPLEDRCNIELNCEDQTDEKNCFGLKLGSNYAKEKIPVSLTSEPITIFINVSLIAFPIISTKDTKFSTDFYLNIRWYDLRLDMWDLNYDFSKNSLSKEELDSLWKPKLSFVNSLLSESYSIQPEGILIKENDPLNEDISLGTEGNKW